MIFSRPPRIPHTIATTHVHSCQPHTTTTAHRCKYYSLLALLYSEIYLLLWFMYHAYLYVFQFSLCRACAPCSLCIKIHFDVYVALTRELRL